MGKCLFFDADGTILDIVKGTPEDTKLALQQLRKNGHKTFICTGRSNAFVPEYLMKEIGFDGLIANLGAYIEYNGTRVFEREMPTDLAWKTVEIIKANGFIPVLEGNDYMYYNLDEYTSDIDWFADLITQELGDKLLPIRGNEHNLHFNKISAKRTPGCNPEKLCQNYPYGMIILFTVDLLLEERLNLSHLSRYSLHKELLSAPQNTVKCGCRLFHARSRSFLLPHPGLKV